MQQNLEIQEICESFIKQTGVDASCIFLMDTAGNIMIHVTYIHKQTLGIKSFDSFREFKAFILKLKKTNSDRSLDLSSSND